MGYDLDLPPHSLAVTNDINETTHKKETRLQIQSCYTDESPVSLAASKLTWYNFPLLLLSKKNIKLIVKNPKGKDEKIYVHINTITKKLGLTLKDIKAVKTKKRLEKLLFEHADKVTAHAREQKALEITKNYERILAEIESIDPDEKFQGISTDELMTVIKTSVEVFHASGSKTFETTDSTSEIKFHVTYDPAAQIDERVRLTRRIFLGKGSFGKAYHKLDFHTKDQRVEKEVYINYKSIAKDLKEVVDAFKSSSANIDYILQIITPFIDSKPPNAEALAVCLAALIELEDEGDEIAQIILSHVNNKLKVPEQDLQFEARNLANLNANGKVWGLQEIPPTKEHTVQPIIPAAKTKKGKMKVPSVKGKMVVPKKIVESILYDGNYLAYIHYIKKADRGNSQEKTKCLYEAFQLLAGLAYAHSIGCIHGDIKPENIFYNHSDIETKDGVKLPTLAISDWGGARQIGLDPRGPNTFTTEYSTQQDRTLAREPPHKDQQKMDIYAIGLTIAARIIGKRPGEKKCSIEDALTKIKEFGFPDKLFALLASMMKENQKDRPTAEQALKELNAVISETNPELAKIIYQQLDREKPANEAYKEGLLTIIT